MRKLKLQMHLSLDSYVNMEQGGINFKWDDEVIKFCINNLESVDTLYLDEIPHRNLFHSGTR